VHRHLALAVITQNYRNPRVVQYLAVEHGQKLLIKRIILPDLELITVIS